MGESIPVKIWSQGIAFFMFRFCGWRGSKPSETRSTNFSWLLLLLVVELQVDLHVPDCHTTD